MHTQETERINDDDVRGYDPWTQSLAKEWRQQRVLLPPIPWADMTLEARQGQDSLWLVVRWPSGGAIAFRTAYAPGSGVQVTEIREETHATIFDLESPLGQYTVRVEMPLQEQALLHWTVTLTPSIDLLLPFWPTDISPLDAEGDPRRTRGVTHAGQCGLASGFLYFTLTQPRSGSVLYLQDLTGLNELCEKTETSPAGVVGGRWPQLGYTPPRSETKPLPADEPTVLSDAWVRLTPEVPQDERAAAGLFLNLLADLYPFLNPPETLYHDWPSRAEATLRDIEHAPDATTLEMGHRFLRPYLGAEPPDAMPQLAVLLVLLEYQDWTGKRLPLADELRAGVPDFFDREMGIFRRYLPTVGEQKEADTMDSWYLYHPLINLGRLAMRGDREARRLFFDSLDYAIKVARHFQYRWPVVFHLKTLEVLTGPRKEGEPGQSDLGSLYAYVMLQAWDLSGEPVYLEEAKNGVRALSGLGFSVAYQMNLTARGAVACQRLWKITGDEFYRGQRDLLLASYFHHVCFWISRLGWAKYYQIFTGAICLYTGEYMALYECYESGLAWRDLLENSADDLSPALHLLLTESVRYLPSRAWFYYPDTLPVGAISRDVREGWIDRNLSLPLEDLFPDGKPAGPTGQEIYGAGAAFAIASHYYRRPEGAPFLIYSEFPLFDSQQTPDHCFEFRVRGDSRYSGRLRLMTTDGTPLPDVQLAGEGVVAGGERTPEGHREWWISGGSHVEIRW